MTISKRRFSSIFSRHTVLVICLSTRRLSTCVILPTKPTMRPLAYITLWSGTNKNRDLSTGPLARPFACSLAPLTRSLAPDCSLRSRPPLRSLPRSWESEFLMSQNDLVLSHSAVWDSGTGVVWTNASKLQRRVFVVSARICVLLYICLYISLFLISPCSISLSLS